MGEKKGWLKTEQGRLAEIPCVAASPWTNESPAL